MTNNLPPYFSKEIKDMYPSLQGDPLQQQQQQQQLPVIYLQLQQGAPVDPAGPGMTSVTCHPQASQEQQPQQLTISQLPSVVVTAGDSEVMVASQEKPPTLICQIVTAYFASVCCFCPCGLVAFAVAGKQMRVRLQSVWMFVMAAGACLG